MSSKKRTIMKAVSIILSLMLVFSVCLTANAKNIVGYYTEWSIYTAHNTYCPSNIPWNKVTVVNYAFSNPTTSGIQLYDAYADTQKSYPGDLWNQPLMGNFNQLNVYKAQNPGVKTMISLGGWTLSGQFSDIAASDATRTSFSTSAVAFIRLYGFDGVDIDWEYPVGGGLSTNHYSPNDKHNYTLLLQNLRSALDAAGTADGKHYYLSIAAPAGYGTIANTEPDQYNQYLDWINLMTYDYHGGFDPTTNHLAPLYANPNDNAPSPANTEFNVDWTVNKYLSLGVPAAKLNIGLPYYSRGWSGVTGGTNGLYGNATGSPMGVWDDSTSGPTGTNPYYYVKATLETTSGYTKYTDSYTKTPWLYSPSAGILYTYDDDAAISTKCDYINSKGLGGAMFWEFSGDYPLYGSGLTSLIASKIGVGGPTTTPGPTYTPTPTGTATPTPNPNNTPTPTPSPSYPVWNSTTAYNGAAIVSYNGSLWQAKWWTQGETPGIADVWVLYGAGATATPTVTPAPTSTPTPTPTSGPTSTPTPTPTSGPTSTPTPTPAATSTPTPTPAATATPTPGGVAAWAPNTAYSVGQLCTYGGSTYKCIQAHTSLVGWEPPNVPALWQLQ